MATSMARTCLWRAPFSLRCFTSNRTNPLIWSHYPVAGYAKKASKGAVGPVKEKMDVTTDPETLLKYCCGANYYKEGPEIELKPDSEYPDWLWELHTGPPLTLEELDPDTSQYWRRLKKMDIKRQNKLAKHKKF